MRPTVTVVIPTYGRADYLTGAIASVLAQSRPADEIIVVDDGSPDDTGARLADLVRAGRIRYHRQANAGVSAARNQGAALARGECLLFLDDDDLLYPDALERLTAGMAAEPALGAFVGGIRWFRDAPPPVEAAATDPPRPIVREAFLVSNRITTPGQVLVRRSAFEAVGGFDRRHQGAADWDMWLRLFARHPGRQIRHPTLAYREHATGMSTNAAAMYADLRRVMDRHHADAPSAIRPVVRRWGTAWVREWITPRATRLWHDGLERRDWLRAAVAARVLAAAWSRDVGARVALKQYLLRQGRWTIDVSDPVVRPVYEAVFSR